MAAIQGGSLESRPRLDASDGLLGLILSCDIFGGFGLVEASLANRRLAGVSELGFERVFAG